MVACRILPSHCFLPLSTSMPLVFYSLAHSYFPPASAVLNSSSLEDLCIRDMKILPNYNSSYLPMMPDGSVLVMDNVWLDS